MHKLSDSRIEAKTFGIAYQWTNQCVFLFLITLLLFLGKELKIPSFHSLEKAFSLFFHLGFLIFIRFSFRSTLFTARNWGSNNVIRPTAQKPSFCSLEGLLWWHWCWFLYKKYNINIFKNCNKAGYVMGRNGRPKKNRPQSSFLVLSKVFLFSFSFSFYPFLAVGNDRDSQTRRGRGREMCRYVRKL